MMESVNITFVTASNQTKHDAIREYSLENLNW